MLVSLILYLCIGALAGYIAGQLTKGSGFGLGGNLLVGIVGAFLGGFIFNLLGIVAYSLIGSLITAVVGAVVLLWIVKKVKA
jgi:uncharacterized membrane protein YeaQ/YmgE (transglycosylase-associated protein family)